MSMGAAIGSKPMGDIPMGASPAGAADSGRGSGVTPSASDTSSVKDVSSASGVAVSGGKKTSGVLVTSSSDTRAVVVGLMSCPSSAVGGKTTVISLVFWFWGFWFWELVSCEESSVELSVSFEVLGLSESDEANIV
jgi:hypothetical protein